jgi:hypothetical protein
MHLLILCLSYENAWSKLQKKVISDNINVMEKIDITIECTQQELPRTCIPELKRWNNFLKMLIPAFGVFYDWSMYFRMYIYLWYLHCWSLCFFAKRPKKTRISLIISVRLSFCSRVSSGKPVDGVWGLFRWNLYHWRPAKILKFYRFIFWNVTPCSSCDRYQKMWKLLTMFIPFTLPKKATSFS